MKIQQFVLMFVFLIWLQGDSPFGKSEAYVKLEQLGEGSYATVFKGFSKWVTNIFILMSVVWRWFWFYLCSYSPKNNNNLQFILMIMEIWNGNENTHPGENITIQNNHNLNDEKK